MQQTVDIFGTISGEAKLLELYAKRYLTPDRTTPCKTCHRGNCGTGARSTELFRFIEIFRQLFSVRCRVDFEGRCFDSQAGKLVFFLVYIRLLKTWKAHKSNLDDVAFVRNHQKTLMSGRSELHKMPPLRIENYAK